MSEEPIDLYYPVPFHEDHNPSIYNHNPSSISDSSTHYLQGFDNSYMSFTESCSHGSNDENSLARTFGLSPTLSEAFSMAEYGQKPVVVTGDLVGGSETPVTPNSSISSSSTEAGGEENINKSKNEEQPKGLEVEGERSKKVTKGKKKGEKKEKEQRFAFMTKSEVDHLEDGYRWRKYGQKAVKNSPYPRSYYRCTTQKCTVKKRVERSFEDPSIVITTYEGQHNHLIPATLRGNIAGMYSHSMLSPPSLTVAAAPSFSQEMMRVQRMPQVYNYGGSGSIYSQALAPFQQLQVPDYGLLQDMVPPMFLKQDP